MPGLGRPVMPAIVGAELLDTDHTPAREDPAALAALLNRLADDADERRSA